MQGIILDIDGTLWDSSDVLAQSYNQVLKETISHPVPLLTGKDIKKHLGKTIEDFMKSLFSFLSDEEIELIADKCFAYSNDALRASSAPLFPNVAETLQKLSMKYDLFIVSNCQCGYIEAFLDSNGFRSYIKDFLSNGETGLSKGENIRMIIERNHLSDAVYVGDTKGDFDACNYAGIPFIHAGYGFGQVPEASVQILQFQDLLELF